MGMLDGVISEVGSRFGIGDKARQLIGYLLSYMTGPGVGGLGGLIGKLKNMGLGSIFGGGSPAALTGTQVSDLFGNALGPIASKLGLSESVVSSAAGMAVPAMLAKLAPGGTAPATLPAEVTDLTRQFALPSLGSVAGAAAGAAGAAATSAWSWLTWLLPLVGVGLLALYLMRSCQMESPTTPTKVTPPVGTVAPPVITIVPPKIDLPSVNIPELGKVEGDVRGLFSSATEALSGVKDAATAEAAIPKLTDLSAKLDAAKAMIDKLPAGGKEAIKSLASAEAGKLQVVLDQVKKIGGVVWDKIKPIIDKLMEKFKTLGA